MEAEAVRAAFAELEGWELAADGCSLHREFRFAGFGAAFTFMTRTALLAEKLDHHPDWQNSFNKVVVDLSTHDAGGLTALDFRLAKAMSRFAASA